MQFIRYAPPLSAHLALLTPAPSPQNCLVCIELLLNSNALASLQSPSGDSLLTLSSSPLLAANILHVSLCKAITRRDPEEILALVSLGADPNTQCEHNFNYTPLIIAAKLSHLELTRSLLKDFHANPNLTDSHQWSPLMFATIQKSASSAPASQSSTSFQILQLLVEHGSDLEQRNRDGMTAVQLAAFIQHEAFYRFLSAQR
jgi:ankyrin repeat protein